MEGPGGWPRPGLWIVAATRTRRAHVALPFNNTMQHSYAMLAMLAKEMQRGHVNMARHRPRLDLVGTPHRWRVAHGCTLNTKRSIDPRAEHTPLAPRWDTHASQLCGCTLLHLHKAHGCIYTIKRSSGGWRGQGGCDSRVSQASQQQPPLQQLGVTRYVCRTHHSQS